MAELFVYLGMEKGFMRIKAIQNSHPGQTWVQSVPIPFTGIAEYHFLLGAEGRGVSLRCAGLFRDTHHHHHHRKQREAL